jgi:F-type H+-transporting ATPase subunit gamma
MPQAREIKHRIKSVENTKQITRAMKMVAAAKLRRAQERMEAMRPYAEKLNAILRYVAIDLIGDEHPLFASRAPKKVLTIVVAGDRGLCGGFNSNIIRAYRKHTASLPDREHSFIAIGKRAIGAVRKDGRKLRKSYYDVFDKLSYVLSGEICDLLVSSYLGSGEERVDEVYLLYNEFVNMMSQKLVVKKLLPFDHAKLVEERKAEIAGENGKKVVRPVYEIEPDVESVLERLVSHRLSTEVYRAVAESYAAELSARMSAMDSATQNAEEMIGNLTLIYNRARQASITSELLDIVNGANALEG